MKPFFKKHISASRLFAILCILFFANTNIFAQEESDSCKIANKKAIKVYKNGIAAMKSHKYTEAAKLFVDAIEIEPEYPDAFYGLGTIYLRPGVMKLASVKRYFRKVIELCPDYDIGCYYTLGDIYLGEDKFDSAYYYMSLFMKDPDIIKDDAKYNHADSVLNYTRVLKNLKSNPVPFNPVYVKNISTGLDEYLPLISPDNEMALFVRKIKLPKAKEVIVSAQDNYKELFMFSVRGENGEFSSGEEMPYPFNTTDYQGAATITLDNKTLCFVFCKNIKQKTGPYLNCDICQSERKADGSWTEIKNLGTKVNKDNTWESQPSISGDGKTLYFISDRTGGYGGYDIYKSTKDSLGEWGLAENLGPVINSPLNEKTPYIHSDNITLYFSSQGLPGLGGYDIFYSRKALNGKFGKPVNIGYPINTGSDDVGFTVSTDGHYGYFASNNFSGPGLWDIFSFDLYPEARPDTVLLVRGNVRDVTKNEPTSAKVELKNIRTKQITRIPVDSITGKYIFTALFHDDYILTVKKDDYAYTSKYISKEDTAFTNKPTEVKMDFEVKPIAVGESYRINDIYFAYGSYDLTENSKLMIDEFVDFLNDHPTMKISINGHTDNISDADFNLTLSENRAKSVYDYLISKGIPASRLTYKGYGLTMPVVSNATEEGRAKNRRTEFVIIEK